MSLLDLIPGVGLIKALLDPVASISNAIIAWQNKKLDAKTEQERIEAQENIDTLKSRRDVMVAEAGASRLNMIVRAGLALPVIFLLAKILVYDKALGEWTGGHTDALSPELWQVVMVVMGFYFVDTISKRVIGAFGKR